jgi:hypothetical protein
MAEDSNLQNDSNINKNISNNEHSDGQNNSTTNNEKAKRHRRGKQDTTNERTYKCPDCDKSYLSNPALVMHRRTKHGLVIDGEKRARGRPKASDEQEVSYKKAKKYYNEFLGDEVRKKKNENEKIDKEVVKENFRNIFNALKDKIFKDIEKVEDYQLYDLTDKEWDNKNLDVTKDNNGEKNKKEKEKNDDPVKRTLIDYVFIIFLKEISENTNKKYFEFIQKFILLYRKFINYFKKNSIKKESKDFDSKKEYSQIECAEEIPETFNDFFLDFLQPNSYFAGKDNDYIELAQYFCFWLYEKKYTQSYLTLI